MSVFTPKQRTEIYAEQTARILAFAPLTSAELGEVIDNLVFASSDQIYEVYVEIQNSLSLLKLDNTTGTDLDAVVSEYPNLAPRFSKTRATGQITVTDPNITKIASTVNLGGATHGNNYLNVTNATTFPNSGSVLIGTRGTVNFETVTYTGKSGNQLTGCSLLAFDHGSGELVVKTTVGDRTYSGPYSAATQATPTTPVKSYTSTTALIIYDGEGAGTMQIQADTLGTIGNTPSTTITRFVGSPPFVGSLVTNGAGLANGADRETDPDVRARIRQQRQALSTGNIDAVTSALFNADSNGQLVKFVQIVEDPSPTLPSLAYIDDGSGFTPSQATFTGGITLETGAFGGEDHYYVPTAYLPLVTTASEDLAYVFGAITLKKNGVTMSQGSGAGQYLIQPNRGVIKLNSALVSGDTLTISSITYFTGLVQQANLQIYGDRANRATYPGISSLGTWIKPLAPAVQFVTVQGTLTLDASRPLNDVVAEIQQNLLSYINGLGIGNTVVHNRILALGFVRGVKNFQLLLPVGDVIIPDGTLARTTVGNLIIS